jgi:hypothetical protein
MRIFLAVVFAIIPALSPAEPVLKTGDVLAVTGDSITQQGIYTIFLEDYILMCGPVGGVKVIQCGWGGTTAPYIADQMKNGILTFSPTVATTAFGMNDGDMAVDTPAIEARYRDGLNRLIDNFQKSGTRTVVVGSPGAVDTFYFKNPRHADAPAAVYNETLGKLAEVAKDVAAKRGMPFADLHTPLLDAMRKAKAARGEKFAVCGEADGVHATPNGHLCMAYAFLKALGYDGNIGTITYDAAAGTATATEGHRIVSAAPGAITIESTRYPYCFTRGNDHPFGPTTSILPYLPFNQDLNRYRLVVKNLKSPRARVTWGAHSKDYSAQELATGVNLAADFLDNPFVPAFAAVDKEVAQKHDFQIFLVTFWLGQRAPPLAAEMPDKEKSFADIAAGLRDIDDGLIEDCARAIKPVTHTIQIAEEN